ncbi:probable isocitrate dehydrogenase [NAD] subunit alpha, mitochondrial [Ylistrum balloti]|uniref:probable isocitrate dehydrogenase [NAD] subunit alpha, mitochondrial n=1 Tax=Ylistrum balloti TaxID=509963 RepID=UPI002905BE34|nr:probable isocitrate dehydrogenase [NAD] subunit alpha, mitochondrial [Ylistrum balloti]
MVDVVLIPGDGVGPELIHATKQCIDATGVAIRWIEKEAGAKTIETEQALLPLHVLEAIQDTGRALKGPIITPIASGFRSVNVQLRQSLDLYACVRPCKSMQGIASPLHKHIDVVIIRENTEDLYAGIEFESGKHETKQLIEYLNTHSAKKVATDAGVSIKTATEAATRRICSFAVEYARAHARKKITIVTKSNIMKYTDGLFFRVAHEELTQHSDIQCRHMLIDALCMNLVQAPENFDILLLPNLYGDIVSDLCAGLIGGLGVAPGSNIGEKAVIYEATHGAAPEFAGMNALNPTALIQCGIMLLRDINEKTAANALERALFTVLEKGDARTVDILPPSEKHRAVSTSVFAQEVIQNL